MQNNDNINLTQELGKTALDMVSDLTPITVKEAKEVLGIATQYESDEEVAMAVLDFTAIARAFFRTVPKFN